MPLLRLVGAFVLAVALAVGWGAGRSLAAEDVSSALRAALLSGGPAAADAPQVDTALLRPLYAARGNAPLWVEPAGAGARAEALRTALQAARADGQAHTAALLDAIEARMAGGSARRLAELDLLLTQALAGLGAEPGAGPPAAAAVVTAAAQAADLSVVLQQILPASPDYWRLRGAIERYRAIAAAGGWPTLPGTAKLSLGAVGPEVAVLRRRLAASGDLPAGSETAAADVFDAALDAAVRAFQARHGLEVDGIVGPRTRAALNVSVHDRLATMVINLERLRRLSPPDYALVNIPAAEFRLVEAGRTVMRQRAIVGRPDRPTPELHSAITRIELNPYWNVPPRIARLDIVPKIRRDPGYLAREGIRVLGPDGEVDPAGIDWSAPAAARYRLRQDPGPLNALGVVKFHIPNPFDVYLHDTPSKALFRRAERFFSSGCIRLERPLDLARHLLRGDPVWGGDVLERAAELGRVVITLPRPMPIHLVYLTAWVDESGTVQFRRDVYGRDTPAALADRVEQAAGRACGAAVG